MASFRSGTGTLGTATAAAGAGPVVIVSAGAGGVAGASARPAGGAGGPIQILGGAGGAGYLATGATTATGLSGAPGAISIAAGSASATTSGAVAGASLNLQGGAGAGGGAGGVTGLAVTAAGAGVGSVGVFTLTPTADIGIAPAAAAGGSRTLQVEQNTAGAGTDFALRAGAASGANATGGNAIISGGASTGTAVSAIRLQVAGGGSATAPTTVNTPVDHFVGVVEKVVTVGVATSLFTPACAAGTSVAGLILYKVTGVGATAVMAEVGAVDYLNVNYNGTLTPSIEVSQRTSGSSSSLSFYTRWTQLANGTVQVTVTSTVPGALTATLDYNIRNYGFQALAFL